MSQQPPQQYGTREQIGRTEQGIAASGQPAQQAIAGGGQQYAQPQEPGGPEQQYAQTQGMTEQQSFAQQPQGMAEQQPQGPAGGPTWQPPAAAGVQSQGIAETAQRGTQPAGPSASPTGQAGEPRRDVTLEDGISDEMRVALHDFVQAANVCEWCAEQCLTEGPEMAECVRLCRDVADLATLNAQLLTRDSVFGPEAAEVFAVAADACARECARHAHKHCQECAEVLPRAARSTRKMLASFEGRGQEQQQMRQGMQPGAGPAGQF